MTQAPDQVLTVAQMQAAEQALIDAGTSVDELMLRAGRGAADTIRRIAAGRRVTVLCGPGNNGGDGYVIAETLRARGGEVTVVAPIEPKTDAAREARSRYVGEVRSDAMIVHGEVFVDALFGSGLSRGIGDDLMALLDALHRAHERRVAVDLPSVVFADSGEFFDQLWRHDCTLALGAWKFAHFSGPSAMQMGALRLVDIGVASVEGAARRIGPPELEPPGAYRHKYSRGLLGVIGGDMPGAAGLAARAAMRAGAGYVKLFADSAPAGVPHALVVETGSLAEALEDDRITALLVGPGLGRGEAARERVALTLETGKRVVLDADALHLFDDALLDLADPDDIVVTPHEGELRRLCENFAIETGAKRTMAARLFEETGLTVLAKGPDTTLHGNDYDNDREGDTGLFPPGPSWLSTAGSGDVLAGILGSRMAAGRWPFEAAAEAVWIHNEAARLAGPAFTADDLADAVSDAFARFL